MQYKWGQCFFPVCEDNGIWISGRDTESGLPFRKGKESRKARIAQEWKNKAYLHPKKEEAGEERGMKKDIELCEENKVHESKVKGIAKKLPKEEDLWDLAELFKAFGDTTRIRILYVLDIEETCVCDIAELLNLSQSAISHQLKILKGLKLVKSRREGKTVYYSLADSHVRTIIDQGLEHIME